MYPFVFFFHFSATSLPEFKSHLELEFVSELMSFLYLIFCVMLTFEDGWLAIKDLHHSCRIFKDILKLHKQGS